MDYKISFSKMDQLGQQANLNKCKVPLSQMRKQALDLKSRSISEAKKRSI